MRMKKRKSAVAAVAAVAVAVTLAAAGYATTTDSDTGTDAVTASATTTAAEPNLDSGAPVRTVDEASTPAIAGGYTVVRFTEAAVEALGPLEPTGVKPGAFGLSPTGLGVEAAFPITGDATDGVIEHTGALALRSDIGALTLGDYRIDTAKGVLTATATIQGQAPTTIEFLTVAPTEPATGCDVSANVTLTKQAADALTLVLGAPDLTGAPIGNACVMLG